jgi:hypothetical protein
LRFLVRDLRVDTHLAVVSVPTTSEAGDRMTPASRPRQKRVPWVWCRIVRASKKLSSFEKLVYDELRGLSMGRGATVGAGPLGLRLGVSRETIERARRRLTGFGLIDKLDLGPGRAAAWLPKLPKDCRPASGARRLADENVQELADRLDKHIQALQNRGEGGVGSDATQEF